MILLMLILNSLMLNAQDDLQEQNHQYLQGTWLIDTMYIDFEMSEQLLEIYAEKFQEIKLKTRFEFHPDGKYEKISGTDIKEGNWRISPNGKMIIIQFVGSDEISRTHIGSLDSISMTMIPVDNAAQNSRVELIKQ
jgi:hypothetical protein